MEQTIKRTVAGEGEKLLQLEMRRGDEDEEGYLAEWKAVRFSLKFLS